MEFFATAFALLLLDFYIYRGLSLSFRKLPPILRKAAKGAFGALTISVLLGAWCYFTLPEEIISDNTRSFLAAGVLTQLIAKLVLGVFLLFADSMQAFQWGKTRLQYVFREKKPQKREPLPGQPISRAEFLAKTGMMAASVPIVGVGYGILSGAHDYTIRKATIALPNLPSSFHGIRIAQLSDIHSGSFFNKRAVMGGVEMLLNQKPDLIFFTGDLVNNRAKEVNAYIDVFSKLHAPLGIFSVLGNHDYGEYVKWRSEAERQRNLADLMRAQKNMGWQLLMNEHHMIEESGDKLAILGIENWSNMPEFPKYGNLQQAHARTQEAAAKLLLSHDPSHWDAQVRTLYTDIDVMFAGHTHGMQCGIEVPGIKWSPAQYLYKQWAGLYQEDQQYLYVNRGFGFLDFPGRIGMPPEITIIELQKA